MTMAADPSTDFPVRKSLTVKTSVAHAFNVFTDGFDSWWPRGHHIGSSPMKKGIIEGFAGGRCYSEQIDGSECDWGTVLVWEPPHRLVLAWQINPTWKYEPDIKKASEVEVTFTAQDDGGTRVELEHRYFHRHGEGFEKMREGVGAPGGWGTLLQIFATQAEQDTGTEPA
jgi:uncharacterized protein YndB with AHSA1/START domain